MSARNPVGIVRVQTGMDEHELINRETLIDAGLDPDDPAVWATQRRVRDLLLCIGIWRAGHAVGAFPPRAEP
ncbi:hypothetical protein ACWEQ0_23705 [Nocardia thailandica]